MAWKPKTIFGKIIKGAAVVGGSVLGLTAVGKVAQVAGKGIKAVGGLIAGKSGTAAMVKNDSVLSLGEKLNVVKEKAAELVTGKTKEQRQLINEARETARDDAQKLRTMEKLIDLGTDPAIARSKVGLSAEEAPATLSGEPIKAGIADMFSNPMVKWIGLGLLALIFLPKLLKGLFK